MKISVIIPVFNCEDYLSDCIDSVLNQTWQDFEIILINDGSQDNSGRVCEEFAKKDARISYIEQENRGVSNARNVGLKKATGDLISFIDSDDQLEEDMYDILVELMLKYDADISHCGYKRLDEEQNIVKEISGTHKVIEQNAIESIECMLNGVYFTGGLWNKLFKVELIKEQFFCEELKNNEDILFNVQAFAKAKKIVFIDETKYRYFEHPTSTCNQLSKLRQYYDSVYASEKMLEIENDEIRKVVYKRLFESRINYYRFLIFHPHLIDSNQKIMEKKELSKSYKNLIHHSLRESVNYYMLMIMPMAYKFIYRMYDSIRKPNWDVKGEEK